MDTMARIQEIVPEVEWPYLLLCGDWNIDISFEVDGMSENSYIKQKVKRMNEVKEVCKQMKLNLKFAESSREEALLIM